MSAVLSHQLELTTPRLRLRRLRPHDAALLGLYASDARVARMTATIPHPYPPGQAEAFVKRALSGAATETVWAMDAGADRENGLIGVIGLRPPGGGECEIFFWVAPAFWGTGFASEAVEALVAHAPARGCAALVAQAFQDNAASIRVLTRTGFAYVGAGEMYSVARAAVVPNFRYRRDLVVGGEGRG